MPDNQEDDSSSNMEYGVSSIVWLEIFGSNVFIILIIQ